MQQSLWSKLLFFFGAFSACVLMAFNTGCASGGYKLTRQYARWVNSKNILFRIIIYILTGIIFAITLLIDTVIFNTIDFWEGKVSEGKYEFKDADKIYQVQHEFQPGTGLKRSTITILGSTQNQLQQIVLNETQSGEIEMMVDGKLRTRVQDITTIPVVSHFDEKGRVVDSRVLLFTMPILNNQYLARK